MAPLKTSEEASSHPYTHRWVAGIGLYGAFVASTLLSSTFFPAPSILFIGSGIAVATLFLAGLRLWPVVFVASLTGQLLHHAPPVYLFLFPIAHTLLALLGAFMLRYFGVDPLFRRTKDMVVLIGVVFLISAIVPTIGTIAHALYTGLGGVRTLTSWGSWYTATIFSLLVSTPFIMRWSAKFYFERTSREIIELLSAFALLGVIDYALFFTTINALGGVPLTYIVFIPFFWIALRLRPRFLTAALVLSASLAMLSLFLGPHTPEPNQFSTQLFEIQLFFIVLAILFYIIATLEENRRVTTNLLQSQLSSLETRVSTASSESKAKNDFIAILGHELRNPLTPIAHTIEYLKEKPERDPEEKKAILVMEQSMQTVSRLLDDLLDVTKISERKINLQKEKMELGVIVARAQSSVAPLFKSRHQTLTVEGTKEPLWLNADPVRIEQIICNLLTNASRYSRNEGITTLSLEKSDTMAVITVKDNGIGINDDMLENIFEPFRQGADTQSHSKGLGIGLSLVKSFTELHGGHVTALSEGKDKGSTFTVALPLTTPPAPSVQRDYRPVAPEKLPSPSVKGTKGGTVLVVDDNDAAAWGVGRLLELHGYTVEYAYTGNQAIERATESAFDAILLDIGLPDQTGYQVARTLRARGYTGTLIALSGYNSDTGDTEGGSCFEHYLVKPVGLVELLRVMPSST